MKKNVVLIGLLICAAVFVCPSNAQTPQPKPSPNKTPESAEESRTRRASPTPVTPNTGSEEIPLKIGKPEETVATAEQEPKAPAAAAPEKPFATEGPKPTADPVKTLRDQIDAALTEAERMQLRLKLVEEFLTTDKKAEALSELRSITNTDVFYPPGFYNAGNALARLGESEGSIDAYRKAIEQRKGNYSRAFNNLGVVLLRLGRWDESYDALTSALKLENFTYPEASYNLGRLYAARGQSDLAVREWRRVLAMSPEHAGAKDALMRVPGADRIVIGPTTSARSNETRAATPTPVITTASDKPSTLKSSPPSGQNTQPTLRLDQASYDFLQQARTSLERGDALVAIDNYKRLINRQGGYFPPANLELSFAYLSLKRYDEALTNLLLVSNRDGARYPISYFHLARVYELQGNLPQAQQAFSKAVKAFGMDNPQFLLDVSRVLEKQGDYKSALAAMETYAGMMKQQGLDSSSTEERLTALRQKVATAPAPKN
ncbi:MAG: hypothetical protein DMF69_05980 [Acidobacteria bacterium]|nr:MAG: hypothetical protein DMF69_05980 [Acidobacteriota bacterium]